MTNTYTTPEPAGCRESQVNPQLPAWAGDKKWNIFRRKDTNDLLCAVPCDCSVPSFLFSGEWKDEELKASQGAIFLRLKEHDAHWAVQRNGFYLFMCFSKQDRVNRALS